MKIDISDVDNVLPCYFQLKKTQTTPSIKKINSEVGKTDKPLCILWNIQQKKEGNINITSAGEYAIIPKDFFYNLIKPEDNSDSQKIIHKMIDLIGDLPNGYEPIIESLNMDPREFYRLLENL